MAECVAFFELDGYRVEAWPADACPDDPDGQHFVGCGCDEVDPNEVGTIFDVFCEGEHVGEIVKVGDGCYERGDSDDGLPDLRTALAPICYDIARGRQILDAEPDMV